MRSGPKAVVMAALTAIAFVVVVIIMYLPLGSAPSEAQNGGDGGNDKTPVACAKAFTQHWDPNVDEKFRTDGLWDNPDKQIVTVKGADQKQRALSGHDARYLAGAAWTEGLWTGPNDVEELTTSDKSCLSPVGVKLHNKLVKKWDSAKAALAAAPADGVNTSSQGGTFTPASKNGINGNRTALVRTYPNGSKTIVLIRCGNFVLPPGTHAVPEKHKPKCTTCKPRHEVCKWNHKLPPNSKKCLQPKNIQEAPQHDPKFPEQQKPNPLPADPSQGQPVKPSDPPATHKPAPAPEPTKKPRPDPTQPPATGAPDPGNPGTGGSGGGGCVPAPGEDGC